MEKGSSSSGKRNTKAVQLNLGSPVNVQKGRTLVGRLETDKNLNRGIVISMIKKGWGLDRDMEVHEITNNNAFLFRFSSQADYNRILKGRPNCKYPAASKDEDDTEGRAGNSLGTPHVKTKEDTLVVHDRGWDEGMTVQGKPPAVTAEPPNARRLYDDYPRKGSNIIPGENSGSHLWRSNVKAYMKKGITIVEIPTNMEARVTPSSSGEIHADHSWKGADLVTEMGNELDTIYDKSNGQASNNYLVNAQMRKEITIIEIPTNMETGVTSPPSAPHSSHSQISPLNEPIRNDSQPHIDPDPATSHPPFTVTPPDTHKYLVDFPDKDIDPQPLSQPIIGLSPISAVTKGLNQIHLKRQQDPLKEDQLLNPTKKRLLFLEQASETIPLNPTPSPTTIPGAKSLNCRKIKNIIRGSKGKRRSKIAISPVTADSSHSQAPNTQPDHDQTTSLLPCDTARNADGCHQATIGSP
ncbi:hypothetical protein K1719_036829 [Acacia pycnantha]|nr:hypothetical protein K1719_036829 [Acacia pycnantha]